MYLAGVSVRRVEDITEALWGSKVSPATISELNKKAYVHIEDWRNRPLRGGHYPYVYVDGIYLRRNCRLISLSRSLQTILRINLDGTNPCCNFRQSAAIHCGTSVSANLLRATCRALMRFLTALVPS